MAKQKASGEDKAVERMQAVPGVGKTTAQKLVGAGIRTSNQLAKASMKRLLGAGLTGAIAKKLVLAAAKQAAPKVKAAAKAAPQKVKAAAKATPKKVVKAAKTIKMAAKTAAARGVKKAKMALPAKKKKTKMPRTSIKKTSEKTVEVSSKTIATPNWRDSLKRWKQN
jgi:nucleotidyltransferase/DNA polymerase involved in DNA repair